MYAADIIFIASTVVIVVVVGGNCFAFTTRIRTHFGSKFFLAKSACCLLRLMCGDYFVHKNVVSYYICMYECFYAKVLIKIGILAVLMMLALIVVVYAVYL